MERNIAQIALFAAMIAALGLVPQITLGFGVPITAQTLGVMLAGAVLLLLTGRSLDALTLGSDAARSLGVDLRRLQALVIAGTGLAVGAGVAVTGVIGFVGLVVPHLCRLLVGVDHRWLLPFSALAGAALLVGSDILGRILARPSELDVGIVAAFIGAPFFIWIVRHARVKEL